MTKRTLDNLSGIRPELKEIVIAAWPAIVAVCDARGIRPEIICGHRPQAEQDRLYAKGRTRPGPKVTWTRTSKHNSGKAVDFGLFRKTDGAYLDESNPACARECYSQIGKILTDRKLRHGREFGDDPHFELR